METYFFEYLLNTLDEETRQRVEAHLAKSSEARRRLALLRESLEPLAADAEILPPARLVERTLARVAEQACATSPPAPEVTPAPTPASIASPARRSWRPRADLLVAACLLFTVVGIALIVLNGMRGPDSAALVVECQNNLRQFHGALQAYYSTHGQFPHVAKQSPRGVAGMVAPILAESGTLPKSASIRCPGGGMSQPCRYTLSALDGMTDEEFNRCAQNIVMCYAYSLGYRDDAAKLHPPCDKGVGSFSQTPLMADRPPAEGVLANSMNHGGKGQNVLFADGHIAFLIQRTFGPEDDIFLNTAGRTAAGVGPGDIVLGYSGARP